MTKIKVELIENFLVVWNSTEGSQLYKTAYYGKPLGIPLSIEIAMVAVVDQVAQLVDQDIVEVEIADRLLGPN